MCIGDWTCWWCSTGRSNTIPDGTLLYISNTGLLRLPLNPLLLLFTTNCLLRSLLDADLGMDCCFPIICNIPSALGMLTFLFNVFLRIWGLPSVGTMACSSEGALLLFSLPIGFSSSGECSCSVAPTDISDYTFCTKVVVSYWPVRFLQLALPLNSPLTVPLLFNYPLMWCFCCFKFVLESSRDCCTESPLSSNKSRCSCPPSSSLSSSSPEDSDDDDSSMLGFCSNLRIS